MNQQKAIDSGLLILRVALGMVMLAHGLQKIGVIPGGSLEGTMQFIQSLGLPSWMTWLNLSAELGGGIAVLLGLFGRLGAFAIAVDMAVATIVFHWKNGFWITNGGIEWTLTLFSVATAIMIMGMGNYSVDSVMAKGMDRTIAGTRS